MGVRQDSVRIHDYDPLWPSRFDELRRTFALALQPLFAAIEHVGSTAVLGLAAKPIIDIDILLKSDADLPLVVAKLASLGYAHRGDLGITGREAFRPLSSDFPHHLYVCLPSGKEYLRHIAFRDYLRADPDAAAAYSRLKRELAIKFAGDREAYNQGKSAFVEEVLERLSPDLKR
jgi:GrpB-like predicted nucleotidyltransferase (UPF0157 family)